jgi:hypothetical protein
MSRSLHVYATHFPAVRAVLGSQDRALVKTLSRGGDAPELTGALEEIVGRAPGSASAPWRSSPVWLTFAQERLCEAHGRALPNDGVSGTSLSRLEELDRGLTATGLSVSLESLMYGGGPLKGLPWPDDFPSMGHWTPEETAALRDAYGRLKPESEDPDVDEVLVMLGEWLERSQARDHGLVGVYY